MSEMFISVPSWSKEGREKARKDKNYYLKCCKCGLNFVGYEFPTKCPFVKVYM